MGDKETSLALHFNNTSRERGKTKSLQAGSCWEDHSLTSSAGKPNQCMLPFRAEARAQERESCWVVSIKLHILKQDTTSDYFGHFQTKAQPSSWPQALSICPLSWEELVCSSQVKKEAEALAGRESVLLPSFRVYFRQDPNQHFYILLFSWWRAKVRAVFSGSSFKAAV